MSELFTSKPCADVGVQSVRSVLNSMKRHHSNASAWTPAIVSLDTVIHRCPDALHRVSALIASDHAAVSVFRTHGHAGHRDIGKVGFWTKVTSWAG